MSLAKTKHLGASSADSLDYVIEYDEFSSGFPGENERHEEIREILAQMFIRARKRGRPRKHEEELENAA